MADPTPRPIPELVKRMTVAIYGKPGLSGSEVERFNQAFTIARAQCVKYDLIGPVAEDLSGPIALTTKGEVSERKHRNDLSGRGKSLQFDQLFQLWSADRTRAQQLRQAGQLPTAPAPVGQPQVPQTHRQGVLDKLRDAELRANRDRE